MDIAMNIAQKRKLLLFGQVDQLIENRHADDVAALLHKSEAPYLGKMCKGKSISAKD